MNEPNESIISENKETNQKWYGYVLCVCVCVYVESLMIRKAKGVQWQNTDPLTKWQL